MASSGQRLKAVREAHGLTAGELSRLTGIDRAYLSRVENGRQRPSVEFLARVGKELGLRQLLAAIAVIERFR
jgi:transcriptional regulator with XRE-family HTH domain